MSSDDAFTRLIARLESEAAAKPRRYRFHVALLAGLGYGYLIALLLMLFAIIGGLAVASVYAYAGASFFVKLAIPVGALAVGLLRALWVKFPEPTGRPLDLARCPALRSLIDDLRHRTRGPIIHKVLFTTEFNASIAQMPRLGPFGAYRNILLIGFPLLLALSPGQFAAVLAHEYGHLASADGRFAGWIYRARQTWSRVALHIRQKQRWGSFLVRRFINWYAPYFNAYSFVLARSNEYAADRWSAEIAGARNTADALVTIAVAAHSLDHDFWPALRRRANTAPLPDLAPCDAMPGFLASRDPAEIERGLTRTLDRKTGLADTHPSLADRLRALGEPPRLLPPAECSAADVLLGEEARALAHDLDADWQAAIRPHWQRTFAAAETARAELKDLRAEPATEDGAAARLARMAELTERLHGLAAAVPLYREVLALDPAHAGAHFAVGRTLLEANEAEGLGHLDRAMAGSCDLIIPACITAAAYLRAAGRDIEARRYDERARERQALLAAAQAERSVLRASDDLIPHGLDEAALATILAQLRASPCIKAAYLARKKLAHFPEQPLYVVGVIVRLGIWRRERRRRRLIDRAARELRMPSRFIIVPMTWRNRRFARKLRPARIAPPRT